MANSPVASLCRLTIRTPTRTIDLAVPADVPVADLLPALLAYGGDELGESGVEHEGWVLQRLGGPPLDQERTLESLDLHDGDTLYLRPHTDALPEVRLDDLVSGIASAMKQRPHAWTEQTSRVLLRGLAAATLVAVLLVLALPGGPVTIGAAVAVGVLLLAGAAAASRAVGDAAAAGLLGLLAGPFLAMASWLLPGGPLSGPHEHRIFGARLLAAAMAEAGSAVLAMAVVATFAPLFLSTALVGMAGVLAAVLMISAEFAPEQAAAVVAVAAVVFGLFVPTLSFRFSGLRMPPLPTNTQQLQEGIEPRSPESVAASVDIVDAWMTALYGAVGTICAVCLAALTWRTALAQELTAADLSLLLLLHGRGLGNARQRLFMVVPGVWGVVTVVGVAALRTDAVGRLLLAAGLLVVGSGILVASWTVPGRRLAPYWARAAELLHTAMAVGLLPLALWTLGVYGRVRALV